jgi:hypothetical protein
LTIRRSGEEYLPTPEERARQNIDRILAMGGWDVRDMEVLDLSAARGVAIREFPLKIGFADSMQQQRCVHRV